MAQSLTFPLLQSINTAVTTAYNVQIDAVDSVWREFCSETTSEGDAELYPRLDMIAGLREWIGDRVTQQLGLTSFSITNRTFEETISVRREQIEDDKYGFLGAAAGQLGQNAGELPDLLVAQLLAAGHSTPTYDLQNFFDTAHPQFDRIGNSATVPNYFAPGSGAGPAWYLFDSRKVIKAMIVQRRRPFTIVPRLALTDPRVFDRNEFTWGVDGRMNVGFGIWNLAAMSTYPLTRANFELVRNAMTSHHKPNGAPLNIRPTIIVVPSALFSTAKRLFEGDYDIDSTSVIASNPWKGYARVIENTWLN